MTRGPWEHAGFAGSSGRQWILLAILCASVLFVLPAAQAQCVGQLHVHVFTDTNGNGVLDPGEPGLQGVTVQLDQFADGTIDQTATTDVNGEVSFAVVAFYRVRVSTPAGAVQTSTAPSDAAIPCAGTASVSFGIVAPAAVLPAAPALSATALGLLALMLAVIAIPAQRL